MTGVFCLGISTLDYVYSVEMLPTRGEKYRSQGPRRRRRRLRRECLGRGSHGFGGRCWLATRLADDLRPETRSSPI